MTSKDKSAAKESELKLYKNAIIITMVVDVVFSSCLNARLSKSRYKVACAKEGRTLNS